MVDAMKKVTVAPIVLIVATLVACASKYEINRIESVNEKIQRLAVDKLDEPGRRLIVRVDRMDEVTVANVTYKEDLTFDLYYPPDFPAREPAEANPVPFVVFPLSFTVETFEEAGRRPWKDDETAIQWGQLLAARGTAAVIYDTSSVNQDLDDLMELLLSHGSDFGLDTTRVGVIAMSANGRIGMKLALDNRPEYVASLRVAAFIHAAVRPVAITRKDIPIFIVYTDKGATEFDSLSKAFVQRGNRAGLEITIRDDAPLKGFEYDDPQAPGSQEIIIQLLDFMDRHLQP